MPLNLLFMAINYYISTGGFIGTGLVIMEGPQNGRSGRAKAWRLLCPLLLLVNTGLKNDLDDFEKFKSRFAQLAPKFGLKLE